MRFFRFTIIFILFLNTSAFAITLDDNGQISKTDISRVVHVHSEADILQAIIEANNRHLPIAIMGKQHSQGGQSLAEKAIALDMLSFNKVLSINTDKKQVTVQSGITWGDLQTFINPYNLSIKSMQSPNIFTVGGSISVNAHGDDFRAGSVGNSIIAFHILLANGKKILVTPTTEPTLWNTIIGGYGLLGVITDVTLQLTDNHLLVSHYQEIDMDNFLDFFRENILPNKNIVLFYAHLNNVPGEHFVQDMYVITYKDTLKLPNHIITLDNLDKWNFILTPLFNISRYGNSGKAWRWNMEKHVFKEVYNSKIITRNNAMEKPVRFASDHHSKYNADWLQEYFIPIDNLPQFIKILRKIISENKVNLLNITIRYVPAEPDVLLSYAKTNSFAVVLYFNQDLSARELEYTQVWTRRLIDAALLVEGKYYLPYANFAIDAQFKQTYPGYKEIIEVKKKYDPENIFTNHFHQKYFNGVR